MKEKSGYGMIFVGWYTRLVILLYLGSLLVRFNILDVFIIPIMFVFYLFADKLIEVGRNTVTTLLLFCFLSYGNAGELSIASWNVRNLSNSGRSDAELGCVALVLQRYDVVALQEVLDNSVAERINKILNDKKQFGLNYSYAISKPLGSSGKKERYAFFYDSTKVSPIYHTTYPDILNRFARTPFYCEFIHEGKTFGIISIHVVYGDDVKERLKEIEYLKEIYHYFLETGHTTNILIVGDFNICFAEKDMEFPGFEYAVYYKKTTIYDVSSFDNILWPNAFDYKVRNLTIFEFDSLFFSKQERLTCSRVFSDHRPISVLLEVS